MAQKKSLKNLKLIKPLNKWLNKKEIEDIIIFGSFLKGKKSPKDTNIAIIFKESSIKLWQEINKLENYHFTKTSFSELISNQLIWQTPIHEGFNLKHNNCLSEILEINSYFLFEYEIDNLKINQKQTFNHSLYGSGGRRSFLN